MGAKTPIIQITSRKPPLEIYLSLASLEAEPTVSSSVAYIICSLKLPEVSHSFSLTQSPISVPFCHI
ncbi:hypothetical protein CapIbe_003281 [Capra ibex]